MVNKFRGVGVALITPFTEDQSIDYPALAKILDSCIAGGVDYLVVNGTTSEASTLTPQEKKDILDFIIERNTSNLPIMYGIGANNTAHVLELIEETNLERVDAILTVSPYYNKPSQEGIYQHYKVIADKSPVPVLLYNVPGRTGINMTAQTTLRLAEHSNIFGIKEASGDLNQCLEISVNKPDGFALISGDDMLTVPMISIGATGVISVIANAYPKEFSNAIKKALANNFPTATQEVGQFIPLNDLLYAESNPVGIKEVLQYKNTCLNTVRLPLISASQGLSESIKEHMI